MFNVINEILSIKNSKKKSSKILKKKIETFISKFNKVHLEKYIDLWQNAKAAINEKKIFTIYSSYNYSLVRDILLEKGWIEKLSDYRLSYLSQEFEATNDIKILQTICLSKMFRSQNPNLKWFDSRQNYTQPDSDQIINKIKLISNRFNTKNGICDTIKERQWYYISGVSKVNMPRSYNLFISEDLEDFESDYKLTACVNLLKWLIDYVYDEASELDGKIKFDVISFAIEECETYINYKEHKDIDEKKKKLKVKDWNSFQINANKLINGEDILERGEMQTNLLREQAKKLLEQIGQYNPQLHLDGLLNIWIIKPTNLCRGRGIIIERDLENILKIAKKNNVYKYVIQKYIEKPLLIYKTKFDIRQYYLITSTYPLTIWMYKNCYLRFVSQKFNLKDFHESIHLTNNAVQCKYKIYEDIDDNIPEYKMWDLYTFKDYLSKIGDGEIWDTITYPEMKQNIICTMLCSQQGMMKNNNCFEIYGCDFVLDENYKPWLIEINSCPDMSASTPVTKEICKQALEDLLKVVIDYRRNYRSSTGNFECIYKGTITPHFSQFEKSNLYLQGKGISKKMLNTI